MYDVLSDHLVSTSTQVNATSNTVGRSSSDPGVGRFLSPDPPVHTPHYPNNFEGYTYVLNNPLKYFDPSEYMVISAALHRFCMDLLNYSGSWGGKWNNTAGVGSRFF